MPDRSIASRNRAYPSSSGPSLRALPVRVVHGGHNASFGRDRLVELVDSYLRRRDPGYATTAA